MVMPAARDASGAVMDLTDFTVSSTMKKSYGTSTGIDLGAAISDEVNGLITLNLDADTSAVLEPYRYVYDVVLIDGAGTVTRAFQGTVDVTAGVTTITPTNRAIPTNRATFIAYCKRELGAPVININLDDDQIEDAIDDALNYFRQYHYDATHRTYLKHRIEQIDIDNEYIPCDESIITVVRIIKTDADNISLFDFRYQLKLQDFYNFSNVSMQNYYIVEQKMALLDFILNVDPQINFSRHMNRINLNADWKHDVTIGDYFIFEVYQAIDETTFGSIWNNPWLKEYATALIKKLWGATMKKHGNTLLVGGNTLNGQQMYDEAVTEIKELRRSVREDFQAPPRMFLG